MAAIDNDGGPGNVAGIVGGQEQKRIGNVSNVAEASKRDGRNHGSDVFVAPLFLIPSVSMVPVNIVDEYLEEGNAEVLFDPADDSLRIGGGDESDAKE